MAVWIGGCGKQVGDGDGVVDADEIPQVGWVAELTGHHHDVAGTAKLIDDRTIEITGFTYDGEASTAGSLGRMESTHAVVHPRGRLVRGRGLPTSGGVSARHVP